MKASTTPDTTGFDAAQLIEQNQVGVWRYLRALGCEPAQADDLMQETFLAVLQHPFTDFGAAATAAYLRKVAYNLFISAQRRGGKVKVIAVEDVEEFDRAWQEWAGDDSGEAKLEALRDCLQELTPRARLALEIAVPRARVASEYRRDSRHLGARCQELDATGQTPVARVY